MTRSRTNRAARTGFTLMEMMVVVILMGIMAVAILPAMRGTYEDVLLRSASRKLIDVFSLASSQAISLNEPHRVRIDPQTRRYFIERQNREDETGPDFLPARDLPDSEGQIDPRISLEIRTPTQTDTNDLGGATPAQSEDETEDTPLHPAITFYPDGTADSVEIVLEDRDHVRRILRINPITARTSIVEEEPPGGP